MEQYKWFIEAIKILGYPMGITIYLLFEAREKRLEDLKEREEERKEKVELERKKASGEYVSWGQLKGKLDRFSDHLKYLEDKVSSHLEKEAMEDIRLAKMETDQVNLKEMVIELKESREKLFSMVADIKTFLMENRTK